MSEIEKLAKTYVAGVEKPYAEQQSVHQHVAMFEAGAGYLAGARAALELAAKECEAQEQVYDYNASSTHNEEQKARYRFASAAVEFCAKRIRALIGDTHG